MRIFSNFDTNYIHQAMAEQLEKYKKEEVFLIRRSRYFFLFYIFPHFIWYLIFLMLLQWAAGYFELNLYIWFFIFLAWLVLIWFRIWYKYLKYICDFTIITPWWITTYKQKWILNSVLKEIPARRITAIETRRPTMLSNIFWFWTIDIIGDSDKWVIDHSDDSVESPWILMLTYVNNPQDVKACISKICFR